jgi:hypothetical protein
MILKEIQPVRSVIYSFRGQNSKPNKTAPIKASLTPADRDRDPDFNLEKLMETNITPIITIQMAID